MDVDADAARRFLVTRHMLAPARSLDGGSDGVLEVFRRLGSVQFDPLAVAGRNLALVLRARVAAYAPAWCERLYERRGLFEAYNKGLSLVQTSEFPWFRAPWLGASSSVGPPRILAEHADIAEQVLERIRAHGPLSALDFERRHGSLVDWFGAPTNIVRAVLEAYAATGVLALARRDGNRRYYDLIERLLPPEILVRKVPLREQLRHKLLSRYRAHGLLGIGGGGDIFNGLGPAKPDPRWPGHPGRTALRGLRRGDALRAKRVPPLRQRLRGRVGRAPGNGATTLPRGGRQSALSTPDRLGSRLHRTLGTPDPSVWLGGRCALCGPGLSRTDSESPPVAARRRVS